MVALFKWRGCRLKGELLLNQFYASLEVLYYNHSVEGICEDLRSEIESTLNDKNRSWSKAYFVEQALASVLTYEQLKSEFARRLIDAENRLPTPHSKFFIKVEYNKIDEGELRSVYIRLLNDLQWSDQRRQEAWQKKRYATWILTFAIAVMLTLMFFLFWLHFNTCDSDPLLSASCSFTKMLPFFIALTSGGLGAIFSLLTQLYRRFNGEKVREVENFASLSYLSSRFFLGILASLFAYFLYNSNMIQLTFLEHGTAGMKDLILPVVIGLLAGFSENLVPNVLQNGTSHLRTGKKSDEKTKE